MKAFYALLRRRSQKFRLCEVSKYVDTYTMAENRLAMFRLGRILRAFIRYGYGACNYREYWPWI